MGTLFVVAIRVRQDRMGLTTDDSLRHDAARVSREIRKRSAGPPGALPRAACGELGALRAALVHLVSNIVMT